MNDLDGCMVVDLDSIKEKSRYISENIEWLLQAENLGNENFLYAKYYFEEMWFLSSRAIINTIGVCKTYEIFELMLPLRYVTWTHEENVFFDELDDELIIYRGGAGNDEELLKGFSWSTNEQQARLFTERFCGDRVLQAKVKKEHILHVNKTQLEIVPKPDKLFDLLSFKI
jgi:hypothetical protein